MTWFPAVSLEPQVSSYHVAAQLSVEGRLFWRSALHWALGSLATAEDPLLPWLAQDLPEIARPSHCADCGLRGGPQVTFRGTALLPSRTEPHVAMQGHPA